MGALFAVLSDGHRREVLCHLRSAEDGVATVDDLVEDVLAGDGSADDRERVEVELRHAILPKLAEEGYVEYDARSRTVRYRGGPLLERVLDVVDGLGADVPNPERRT